MSTRDRLVQIVTAEPGKYYEAELGHMLGVRRQRVHTIAVKEEVTNKRDKGKAPKK